MEPDEDRVDISLLGHVGPYYPYDQNDPSRPTPYKRDFPFGFQAPLKPRRPPKRGRLKKR